MQHHLIIDIGNTRCKVAQFYNDEILSINYFDSVSTEDLRTICNGNKNLCRVIISSVREKDVNLLTYLNSKFTEVYFLDHELPIPIGNNYETPNTLGLDRLAAAVGANNIFPNKNTLVIDSGTAITIDFITANNIFLGGNISPGLKMRYKALNSFTDKLPLLQQTEYNLVIGANTKHAIIGGVQNGLIFEVEGYINHFREKYGEIKVVITGGDALFFDKKLKNSIFVDENVTLKGLNRILYHNIDCNK